MRTLDRRDALATAAVAGLAVLLPGRVTAGEGSEPVDAEKEPLGGAARRGSPTLPGRIKQSVARWCYRDTPLPALCRAVADMGMPAVDLVEMADWPIVHDHGLVVSVGMVGAGTIEDGLNDRANHDRIVRAFEENIPKAAEVGVGRVICFFGNRRGMADAEAIRNSVECLNRCREVAEAHDVTILVELLNSKVSHPDYIGDRTPYGVKVMTEVDSPRVKLLYDIFHMQIMEGDIIRTIRENHQHIAHYHTGGVPGRAEIDLTQELNYVAITKAVIETGYEGYYAHEFVPRGPDPLGSLRAAFQLCDV